jgi:hypothetical protein
MDGASNVVIGLRGCWFEEKTEAEPSPRRSKLAYTWGRSVGGTWPRELLSHVGDVNLGEHDLAEFASLVTL